MTKVKFKMIAWFEFAIRDGRPPSTSRRVLRAFLSTLGMLRFELRSRLARTPLIDGVRSDVLVSLTSYGRRLDLVHLVVESIGVGTQRPGRLVLWVDSDSLSDITRLPKGLQRATRRGLEVLQCENLGPHTKYAPVVEQLWSDHHSVLVTADDDVLYPPWWLAELLKLHADAPENVLCYRAHVIGLDAEEISPYLEWQRARAADRGAALFATGCSGVLYPSRMVTALQRAGRFHPASRSTDDIWLHWVALRNGIQVRQVRADPLQFLSVLGSSSTGLAQVNVQGAKNDEVIKTLYDATDVLRLGR